MSEVTYQVDAGTLPQGSCPSTYQELADLLASIYSVTVSTNNTGIYVSATKPADTTLVWKQLDASTLRPVRDYIFVGGLWLSLHTLQPGTIILWDAAIADISTFDGGDGGGVGTATPISGPMWEYVTELAAKFPVGAGTLPSGTVLSIGDTGGEERHTLVLSELPNPLAPLVVETSGDASPPSQSRLTAGNANQTYGAQSFPIPNAGGGNGHNNMPPYYALSFLRRTIKQYYVVP